MPNVCGHCQQRISGHGYRGRPWPDRPASIYCCYGCLSLGEQHTPGETPRWDGAVLKLIVSLFLAGQSMVLSLAVNVTPPDEPGVRVVLQGLVLLATLLVFALLAGPLLHTAATELRHGRITVEILFLLTLLGALFASLQSFLTGKGPIFFEVASILLVVYTFGRQIGARSRTAALTAARAWSASLATCRLLDDRGGSHLIPVAEIQPGDVVEVRAGELIPVDGVIRAGVGFVGEAALSGEALPVVRRPGDRILAGAASHDAVFQVEAVTRGTARQIDRLLEAVEQARQTPTSLQGQADRLANVFVPLMGLVALLTFAGWSWYADWHTGLFNAMAVLLVACPCALGLAAPIVTWTTLGRLAERGLVVRNGDVLERLASADRVLFDKTGTLTEEQMTLADLVTIGGDVERRQLYLWLAAVQARSDHPVARAFANLAPQEELAAVEVRHLRAVPGCGIKGEIQGGNAETHTLRLGRPEWLESADRPEAAHLTAALRVHSGQRIDVEVDGRLVAVAMVAERLRDSASETLRELKRLGLPVSVLTGDRAERAMALGLGVEAHGSLLPDDKCRLLAALTAAGGRPLFVGDGINDASALATAHAGISLDSGTDLAAAAADATLYHSDLRVLPWAVALCREAAATIRWNLHRAALYNIAGITLAALGLLHPVVAALLMVASSLLVAWSSSRVGARPLDCPCPEPETPSERRIGWQATAHGFALALQGLVVVALLGIDGYTARCVLAGFVIAACLVAWFWTHARTLPHWLDMALGMLTLGNLGMVFGWWLDLGFQPACNCCCCSSPGNSAGMWLGMLVLGNLAMMFGLRRPIIGDNVSACRAAMYGGGNAGMIAGMLLAGWLATYWPAETPPVRTVVHLLSMALGMIGGMVLGHATTLPIFSKIVPFASLFHPHSRGRVRSAEVRETQVSAAIRP